MNRLLIILCSVLYGIMFLNYSYKIHQKKKKFRHIPGPSTSGLIEFFLGNLLKIRHAITKDGHNYPSYISSCFNKFGNVFKIELLDRVIINTIDPEAIKLGLVTKNYDKEASFCKTIAYPFNMRFLGNTAIITSYDYDNWKIQRNKFRPFFTTQNINKQINVLDTKANLFIEHLRKLASTDNYFNLKDELNKITLDIIAQIAFGWDLNSLKESKDDFRESIETVMAGLVEYHSDPFIKLKPHRWPYLLKYKKALNYLRNTGRNIIQNRINEIKEENSTIPDDILSIIIKENKDSTESMEEMIDSFIAFFVAGQETEANSLSFCFLELGKNSNILKKVEMEIDRVIGKKISIELEDVRKLFYIGNVFTETLRLWPPIPSINRVTNEKITINGVDIPENTEISFSIYSSSRSKNYFEDPLEFRPERFDNNPVFNFSFFPFSLGPRSCIGKQLSLIEGKVLLAKIIQNFNIELDPSQSFEAKYVGNLVPKDRVRCKIKLRDH